MGSAMDIDVEGALADWQMSTVTAPPAPLGAAGCVHAFVRSVVFPCPNGRCVAGPASATGETSDLGPGFGNGDALLPAFSLSSVS